MSDNIDWSKAPEGTTHTAQDSAGRWRWFKTDPEIHGALHFCTGEPMEGFPENLTLKPRPALQPEVHAEDLAVDAFAWAMTRRLAQCRAAGKSGWDDPEQCPPQRLAEGLVRAVRAGKLVDVGNYAMMLWKRAQMAQQEHRVRDWLDEARRSDASQHMGEPVEWDGTGLPPVGTVCEYRAGQQNGWECVTVIAWGNNPGHPRSSHSAIFQRGKGGWSGCAWPESFRPILTPEQRAAKERDEAVAAMLEPLREEWSMPIRDVMGLLYDAGWRKTEGE